MKTKLMIRDDKDDYRLLKNSEAYEALGATLISVVLLPTGWFQGWFRVPENWDFDAMDRKAREWITGEQRETSSPNQT